MMKTELTEQEVEETWKMSSEPEVEVAMVQKMMQMKTELRNVGAGMQLKMLKAEMTGSEMQQTWKMRSETEAEITVEQETVQTQIEQKNVGAEMGGK